MQQVVYGTSKINITDKQGIAIKTSDDLIHRKKTKAPLFYLLYDVKINQTLDTILASENKILIITKFSEINLRKILKVVGKNNLLKGTVS